MTPRNPLPACLSHLAQRDRPDALVMGDLKQAIARIIDAARRECVEQAAEQILAVVIQALREGLAATLEADANLTPRHEDAVVMRNVAALLRADLSHDEAEKISPESGSHA